MFKYRCGIVMTPGELRARAQECGRLAARARDRVNAADYKDLAQQWREMAEQVEELRQKSAAALPKSAAALPKSAAALPKSAAALLKPAGKRPLPADGKAKLYYRDLKMAMSEEVVRLHLAEADRHIQAGARTVDRQRRAIAKLDEIGRNTADAKALLATLEQIQNTFVLHREMILNEPKTRERRIPRAPEGAVVVWLS